MLCSTFTSPTLGPVWLYFRDFVSIVQSILVVLLRGEGSRPIGVEDVVRRLDFNGFSELFTVVELAKVNSNVNPESFEPH